MTEQDKKILTTIAPWLTVQNGVNATEFYKNAFGAVETYRLEVPGGGLVVKLSINGAEFWIASDNIENVSSPLEPLGGDSVRMVLTVDNPDTLFAKALNAGASQVFPVSEEHGWRLGRLIDPFGLHWEIGRPLSEAGQ